MYYETLRHKTHNQIKINTNTTRKVKQKRILLFIREIKITEI